MAAPMDLASPWPLLGRPERILVLSQLDVATASALCASCRLLRDDFASSEHWNSRYRILTRNTDAGAINMQRLRRCRLCPRPAVHFCLLSTLLILLFAYYCIQ